MFCIMRYYTKYPRKYIIFPLEFKVILYIAFCFVVKKFTAFTDHFDVKDSVDVRLQNIFITKQKQYIIQHGSVV